MTGDLETLAAELEKMKAAFGGLDNIPKYVALLDQYKADQERAKKVSLVVWSGEYDRVLPAFIIANGARAMEMDVDMYFTFWGLKTLQKHGARPAGTNAMNSALHYMLPGGPEGAKLSSLHMFGLGKTMITRLMKENNIAGLDEQIDLAYESGVNIQACTLAMSIFGMEKGKDFDPRVQNYVGVATYLMSAASADITLFI
ncbi:MAG: hypothetical protein HGA85_02660 [Nanoarchaeota archaeon]|nr:hypothetical protein [Nanoarchaeota archaeon]